MRRPFIAPTEQRGQTSDLLIFLVVVLSFWLGWQVIREAVIKVAPAELSLRLAPTSPQVLTRAAQEDLDAGRNAAALRLSARALALQPFNVRALRIAGLAADRDGEKSAADDMITLAGNWSLRDDPAHSWLVLRRLEQGRSASALAHADTLMRRRTDLRSRYFDLMIALASRNDRQAQGAMVALLQRNPPWRLDFFLYAVNRREGLPVAAALVDALKGGPHPITDEERAHIYQALITQGRTDVVRSLISVVGGPEVSVVSDGGFERGGGKQPFHWKLPASAGVMAEITGTPDGGRALHALISTSSPRTVAEQLVLLKPGRWRISGHMRLDAGSTAGIVWNLICATGGSELGLIPLSTGEKSVWTRFEGVIVVPEACPAQHLRLTTSPPDRAEAIEIWFDDLTVAPSP